MKYKIGSVVQLNQGNTQDHWVVGEVYAQGKSSGQALLLLHEDELDCAGSWIPSGCVHMASIAEGHRKMLLQSFAQTRKGMEIIRALTQ